MSPISFPPHTAPTAYERAREQAVELEGVFLNTLMKEMFASLGAGDGVADGGFAGDTWRGMQAEQLAEAMARAGGIGLADSILADLLVAQEAARAQPLMPAAGAYR